MSKTAGIIAEFNPFHNGHHALVQAVRSAGAQKVVAVMSGNFVQRGSIAVTDKRIRARAALLCGVDLVLELPLVYATAPAHRFAQGAVSILAATGCVDTLAFGSEDGTLDRIEMLAQSIQNPEITAATAQFLKQGITYAKARELAVGERFSPQTAAALATPNNALAIEYLIAARNIGWQMRPFTIQRLGAAHDSETPENNLASASYLRQHVAEMENYVPYNCFEIYSHASAQGLFPAESHKLEAAILSHLRRLEQAQLSMLPALSEGIENRLYAAIRKASSLEALEFAVKTKRYTLARVRRLIMAAFLGITFDDVLRPPPYIRVLGFNANGRELLGLMKRSCHLPVSQSLSRLGKLNVCCHRFAELEALATDLYALALPTPLPCGYEYSASAVILKEH